MMKRLALSMVAAFALATGLVGPSVVHAAPRHATRPTAYCNLVTWTNRTGNWVDFNVPGVGTGAMQAEVAILVDNTDHGHYCGEIKAQAHDDLESGCFTFSGYAEVTGTPYSAGGAWNVYHCTAMTYDFTGPTWYPTCGSGQSIDAENNDGYGDQAYSNDHPGASFNC